MEVITCKWKKPWIPLFCFTCGKMPLPSCSLAFVFRLILCRSGPSSGNFLYPMSITGSYYWLILLGMIRYFFAISFPAQPITTGTSSSFFGSGICPPPFRQPAVHLQLFASGIQKSKELSSTFHFLSVSHRVNLFPAQRLCRVSTV